SATAAAGNNCAIQRRGMASENPATISTNSFAQRENTDSNLRLSTSLHRNRECSVIPHTPKKRFAQFWYSAMANGERFESTPYSATRSWCSRNAESSGCRLRKLTFHPLRLQMRGAVFSFVYVLSRADATGIQR